MTFLSYDGLLAAITDEALPPELRMRVEPWDPQRLKSASIELHIGATIARWRHGPHMVASVGPRALADISERDFDITRGLAYGDRFALAPGEAMLLAVDCWVALGAQLLGKVEGKSSVGRAAQLLNAAGVVEPGFVGVLTLEPMNLSPLPIVYEVGQPVAQLLVSVLDRPTSRPYGHPEMLSRYQGQHEVTPPRPQPTGVPWGADPGVQIPDSLVTR